MNWLKDLKTSRSKIPDNQNKIIFAVGEVDGKILHMYDKVLQKEKELGVQCDWIVCPGSFGVWPDLKFVDRATRLHSDVGDFHRLYSENWSAPRNTLFISGAHEDHIWLNRRYRIRDTQILGNAYHLVNGHSTVIGPKVVGLGKVFSPRIYEGGKSSKWYKYYTYREVEKACSQGPVDLLLTHQAPSGEKFGIKKSQSKGIKQIIYATRPQLVIHSGYNTSKQYECLGCAVISLKKLEIVPLSFNTETSCISLL